jgi:hypothetical protein
MYSNDMYTSSPNHSTNVNHNLNRRPVDLAIDVGEIPSATTTTSTSTATATTTATATATATGGSDTNTNTHIVHGEYRDPLADTTIPEYHISQNTRPFLTESASDMSDTNSDESSSGSTRRHQRRRRPTHSSTDTGRPMTPKFHKLGFRDVERKIEKYYNTPNHRYSSALDILASYLKGHKIIYMEAKTHTASRLNRLMLPAITLSAIATVLAGAVDYHEWGSLLLSILNAFIGVLLGIVNYLKLDAATEAHTMSCHQYDKLQTSMEFASGSVLLFRDFEYSATAELENAGDVTADTRHTNLMEEMAQKMTGLDKKIMEIKEMNRFVIPETVRLRYPVIYHTNIFSIIKKIEDRRKCIITILKNVKNEIRFINYRAEMEQIEQSQREQLNIIPAHVENPHDRMVRLKDLFTKKKDSMREILALKSAFSVIDQMFYQEIRNAEIKKKRIFPCWRCNDREDIIDPHKINKFMEELMDPMQFKDAIGSCER